MLNKKCQSKSTHKRASNCDNRQLPPKPGIGIFGTASMHGFRNWVLLLAQKVPLRMFWTSRKPTYQVVSKQQHPVCASNCNNTQPWIMLAS